MNNIIDTQELKKSFSINKKEKSKSLGGGLTFLSLRTSLSQSLALLDRGNQRFFTAFLDSCKLTLGTVFCVELIW